MATRCAMWGQRRWPQPVRSPLLPNCCGPELVAQTVCDWIAAVGAKTACIESGPLWENGHCESLNVRFRGEMLNGGIFYSLREAQILIEQCRRHYNVKRPHSAPGCRPPAPETIVPMDCRPVIN